MTAIDNSNRLIIRPSAEKGGRREAGKAREIDRVTARAGPPDIFVAFLLSFFLSFFPSPRPPTARARARTYTGFILGYTRYRRVPAKRNRKSTLRE